jgi:hypothetical protein
LGETAFSQADSRLTGRLDVKPMRLSPEAFERRMPAVPLMSSDHDGSMAHYGLQSIESANPVPL